MAQSLHKTGSHIYSLPSSCRLNHTSSQRSLAIPFLESRNSYRSYQLRSINPSTLERDEICRGRKKSLLLPQAQSAEIQEQTAPLPSPESDDEGHSPKWWEKDLGITLKDVHSTQELEETIKRAEGKLVVVEFFAGWCGSCRALYPKLCKLAMQHKDVVFVKVNFEESKPLCKSLKIKVLPYFHLYQGASEEVESFSCNISKLQKLKDALSKYNVKA